MGADKASLPYGTQTLLSHMRSIAEEAGAGKVLVGGGPHGDLPDPMPGAGPVAGLLALARFMSQTDSPVRWVAIPVDMPLLDGSLLRRLAAAGPEAAFFAGHPLPLALTMDNATRGVLEHVGKRLAAGESVSVRRVLEVLVANELIAAQSDRARLVNTNTPEEWAQMIRR